MRKLVSPMIVRRKHPADYCAKRAAARQGPQQPIFPIIVDISKILVFHDSNWSASEACRHEVEYFLIGYDFGQVRLGLNPLTKRSFSYGAQS